MVPDLFEVHRVDGPIEALFAPQSPGGLLEKKSHLRSCQGGSRNTRFTTTCPKKPLTPRSKLPLRFSQMGPKSENVRSSDGIKHRLLALMTATAFFCAHRPQIRPAACFDITQVGKPLPLRLALGRVAASFHGKMMSCRHPIAECKVQLKQ